MVLTWATLGSTRRNVKDQLTGSAFTHKGRAVWLKPPPLVLPKILRSGPNRSGAVGQRARPTPRCEISHKDRQPAYDDKTKDRGCGPEGGRGGLIRVGHALVGAFALRGVEYLLAEAQADGGGLDELVLGDIFDRGFE